MFCLYNEIDAALSLELRNNLKCETIYNKNYVLVLPENTILQCKINTIQLDPKFWNLKRLILYWGMALLAGALATK